MCIMVGRVVLGKWFERKGSLGHLVGFFKQYKGKHYRRTSV